jgi:2-oxoglutarate ferredoxin oxidoreductase subunit beta
VVRFRKAADDYDPTDRDAAYAHVKRVSEAGEVATGLLYLEDDADDMHALNRTVAAPLYDLPYESLCPGGAALDELMREFE